MITFLATLRTRGDGRGAKRFMLENPEREAFVRSFTGWGCVEPGTLTMDSAQPLPLLALQGLVPLAQEPADLMPHMGRRDAKISALRGAPAYYGGVILARDRKRIVILSQQPRPAVAHRLEVLSDVFLRKDLEVFDGDVLELDIYDAKAWPGAVSEGGT